MARSRYGDGTHFSGNLERADLIQQDKRHVFLNPIIALKQVLAYAFALHDDIVQLAACRNLERRAFPVVLVEREQRCDETLDLPRVESGPWRVVEIKPQTRRIPHLHSQVVVEQKSMLEGEGEHAPVYGAPHRPLLSSTPAPSLRPILSRPLSSADSHLLGVTFGLICLPFRRLPPLLGLSRPTPTHVGLHTGLRFLGSRPGQSCARVCNPTHVCTATGRLREELARPVRSVWRSSVMVSAVCAAVCFSLTTLYSAVTASTYVFLFCH